MLKYDWEHQLINSSAYGPARVWIQTLTTVIFSYFIYIKATNWYWEVLGRKSIAVDESSADQMCYVLRVLSKRRDSNMS